MTGPEIRRPIEDRLERALTDTAKRNYPDEQAPPAAVDRSQRANHHARWIAPLLAAAAVAAVISGSVVATHLASSSRSTPPVVGPAPSSVAPSSTSPAPSSTPSTTKAHSTGPTITLSVHGVRLTVPAGWSVTDDGADNNTVACISATGSKLDCVLTVAEPLIQEGQLFRPNATTGMNQGGNFCGGASASEPRTVTVAANEVTVDGQTALYKKYSSPCLPGPTEQWVIPTSPGIIFFHTLTTPALDRTVQTVVMSATLPGNGSGSWLGDTAVIDSVNQSASDAIIDVRRVVPLEQGNYLQSSQTVRYQLSPRVTIVGATTTNTPLTVTQLAQWANGQLPPNVVGPLSAQYAEIRTDGHAATELVFSGLRGHAVTLPASTTTPPTASTVTRSFSPYTSSGSLALPVSSRVTGSCWTSSIALAATGNAYRCMVGNNIYDPCFVPSQQTDATTVACIYHPWDTSVALVTLTTPLPTHSAPAPEAGPWALALDNGSRCVANTGAAFHIDGQALNYICNPGYAAGIEHTDQYDTTVAYAASEASGLSTVHVTTAWTG